MHKITDPSIIPILLHRIGDESLMEGFFLSATSIEHRKAVVPCLNRLERCVEWYRLEESPEVRALLLTRIANWGMKKSLLIGDNDGTAITMGLKVIEQRSDIVLDVLNHHWDKKEILQYLEKSQNQSILQKAACHGISPAIREAALRNLNIEDSSEAVKLALLRVVSFKDRECISKLLYGLEGSTLMELAKSAEPSLLSAIEEVALERGIGHLLVTLPSSACH